MKKVLSKIGMKNIIIISGVMLVGIAIYLNLRFSPLPAEAVYGAGSADPSQSGDTKTLGQSLLVNGTNAKAAADDYFASSQLNRSQARDEEMQILQTIADSADALPDARSSALADIAKIAKTVETEANIESLIKAKGFEECVAVVDNGIANVIVKAEPLLPVQVAQIKEIVFEQAGITPDNIKIIQKD